VSALGSVLTGEQRRLLTRIGGVLARLRTDLTALDTAPADQQLLDNAIALLEVKSHSFVECPIIANGDSSDHTLFDDEIAGNVLICSGG
jgi:uncharacterized membrane protein YccC